MRVPPPFVAAKGERCLRDVKSFGFKAAGLSGLPSAWTPSFIALRCGLAGCEITGEVREAMAKALATLGPSPDGVIVRSSGAHESLDRRGALDSYQCEAGIDAVVAQIARIAEQATEKDRRSLGVVVQTWIPFAVRGHLSNERRVSSDPRRWIWEPDVASAEGIEERSFPLRVDSRAPVNPSLRCESLKDLPKCLRVVARDQTHQDPRCHLEWLWDGSRVWIVQYDEEHAEQGEAPGADWLLGPIPDLEGPLRLFKEACHGNTGFPKAEHVRTFAEAGLPYGDVRVLHGDRILSRLAEGKVSRELSRDLRQLIAKPVVVRTDIRAEATHPELMSARTDVCMSYEQLEGFLLKTAAWIVKQGIPASDVAFLVHRFLLADAGAYAFARPGSSRVLVDATWGIPDSLLFHPHDSFRVDIDARVVERHLRCKTDFIDVDEEGGLRSRPAGVPWDWKPALSNEIALEVGTMCANLADRLQMDVEVMFFVGVRDKDAAVLPWFLSSPKQPLFDVEQARGYYSGERLTIRNEADLGGAIRKMEHAQGQRVTLTVKPDIRYLRSKDFLKRVASVGQRFNTPIELEGSRLSHAYYLLEDAGARVRCVDPWADTDRQQAFGKLVRDLVPVRIQRRGERALVYSANRSELGTLIRAKVIEEAVEYYWAADDAAGVQELADLLELLHAAAKIHDVAFKEVEKEAKRKREERGGFESGVVLVETRPGLAGFGSEGQAPSMSRAMSREGGTAEELPPGFAERKVIRLPGRRLILPVAPPSGWKENRPQEVVLDAEEEAVLTYGPTTIHIQVRPRQKGPGRNQLSMDV
jgi:predicted house-cleaning noncanonical NTP pyrophosphatase (MazG superfamily)